MTDKFSFDRVAGPVSEVAAHLDVIFLHGLTGDSHDTWTNQDGMAGDGFWPMWLSGDIEGVNVYTAGYPSSIFTSFTSGEMSLFERAENILEHIVGLGIGARPLVFIAHSLGGIVVKQVLRASEGSPELDKKAVFNNCQMVIFLATPHDGAGLANIINTILPRKVSKQVKLLADESGYLEDLNNFYRDNAVSHDISTVAYREKKKIKKLSLVVDKNSSNPGVSGTRVVGVDEDHLSIAKPSTRKSTIYIGVKRHVSNVKKKLTESSDSAFDVKDYGRKSSSDRRSLQEKLIDADREFEYEEYGRNANVRFSGKYYKGGLYSKEKEKSDSVLSAIEQRFKTHVYLNKIVKGAGEDEVTAAIQTEVIDPICSNYNNDPSVNEVSVRDAVYFLAGQCHIKWDKS